MSQTHFRRRCRLCYFFFVFYLLLCFLTVVAKAVLCTGTQSMVYIAISSCHTFSLSLLKIKKRAITIHFCLYRYDSMFFVFHNKKSATSNEIADINYFLIFVINIFYIKIAKESRQFCYVYLFCKVFISLQSANPNLHLHHLGKL